jgi:DedD protein
MIDLADQDPQLDLKKRARRRLVGAAALALLAAIVLPLIMDQEPKPAGQDIQIRIPSQEGGAAPFVGEKPVPSATSTAAPAPMAPVVATAPAAPTAAPSAAPRIVPAPVAVPVSPPLAAAKSVEPKAERKTAPLPTHEPDAAAEKARAEAILNGTPTQPVAGSGKYVVQLGVFSDAGNVKKLRERIKAQGYNSFTETIKADKGMKTRVRAGPFTSRDAAMKARDRLKQHMGIDGIVAEK